MNWRSLPFEREFTFKTSRSGGKGGQNVNKVSTRVELSFDIAASEFLDDAQKQVLLEKLSNRINKEGQLKIIEQSERSQLANKEKTIEKFFALLEKAFTVKKKRVATKPSKASKEKRFQEKKAKSEKKSLRRENHF
jgi:ribosome-associated protein